MLILLCPLDTLGLTQRGDEELCLSGESLYDSVRHQSSFRSLQGIQVGRDGRSDLSSLVAILNSLATLFTMDFVRQPEASSERPCPDQLGSGSHPRIHASCRLLR